MIVLTDSGPRTKSHPDLDGSVAGRVVGQRLQVQSRVFEESQKVTEMFRTVVGPFKLISFLC